jgi:hypothetical protein
MYLNHNSQKVSYSFYLGQSKFPQHIYHFSSYMCLIKLVFIASTHSVVKVGSSSRQVGPIFIQCVSSVH